MTGTADPFGTAALRAAALAAWRSSPTRLREDANLEEDHGRGFYRDRVVVELAQNAADAAGPDGGTLLLDLLTSGDATYLVARNTGAPLTAAGVASLASLRASTKSGPSSADGASSDAPTAGTVGRFGVGFAAVRSVSDDITVLTRTHEGPAGVRFSLHATRSALADLGPAAQDVLAARGDALPLLRLPFPAGDADVAGVGRVLEDAWPGGSSGAGPDPSCVDGQPVTAVVLRLRDDAATAAVRAQLDALDPVLLLALPALERVVVRVHGQDGQPGATLGSDLGGDLGGDRGGDLGQSADGRAGGDARELSLAAFAGWHVATARGDLDPGLVGDRPVEERGASSWSVAWAVRPGAPRSLVHAPTPTDEPLDLPGVLVASFPLDATRRHVARSPLAQEVARQAGLLLARVVADVAATSADDAVALVPERLPVGWVDALVREAALDALADVPLFDGVTAREGIAIEGSVGADAEVVDALRPAVPGLALLVPSARTAARTLGLGVRPLADVVDDLSGGLPPSGWRRVFAALAPHADTSEVREALATLPVPLSDPDGTSRDAVRLARGARGTVMGSGSGRGPDGDAGAQDAALGALARLGVRVVHEDAAHPVLARLGALMVDDAALLDLPAVREAVRATGDDLPDADQDRLRDDVLAVVRGVVEAHPATTPQGLDALVLPAMDAASGDPVADQPAGDLALPGSWAAHHLDLDVLDPDLAARWDAAVWRAVGVRTGLSVLTLRDVVLPEPGEDPDLPDDVLDGLGDDVLDHLDDLASTLGAGVLLDELDVVVPLDAAQDVPVAAVLEHVMADESLRRALLARVRTGEADAPSHLAGWLRDRLDGPRAVPGADASVLLRAVPGDVASAARGDADVWRALGVLRSVADADDDALAGLLDTLPAAGTRVPTGEAVSLWRRVRLAAAAGAQWDPAPERVVAWVGDRFEVRSSDDVRVASWPGAVVLGPVAPAVRGGVEVLADALDLDVLDPDVAPDQPAGALVPVPAEALRLLRVSVTSDVPDGVGPVPLFPGDYLEHDRLTVHGHEVSWWPVESGDGLVLHVATTAGLAAALAWAAGSPSLEHAVLAVLEDPRRADEIEAAGAWA